MPILEYTTENDRGFTVAAPGVLRGLAGATMKLPARTCATWQVPGGGRPSAVGCDPQTGELLVWCSGFAGHGKNLNLATLPGLMRRGGDGRWSTLFLELDRPYGGNVTATANGDLYITHVGGVEVRPRATGVWAAPPGLIAALPTGARFGQILAGPDGSVYLIVCTGSDGPPWGGALYRYDPATRAVTLLPLGVHERGVRIDYIERMCFDLKGNLFLRSTSRFGASTLTFGPISGPRSDYRLSGMNGEVPEQFCVDGDGALWFQATLTSYSTSASSGSAVVEVQGTPDERLGGCCRDSNGDVWICATQSGVLQFTRWTKTPKGRAFWRADGSFSYMPDAGATGDDQFKAPVSPAAGSADPDVQIRVTISQTLVSALDQTVGTLRDQPVVIHLAAQTSETASVAYTIRTQPAHGVISVPDAFKGRRGRIVSYQPSAGFTGTDSFTFTAGTGEAASTGTVTLQVGAGPQTQWVVAGGKAFAVAAPGVLGTAGGTVSLPASSWMRHTGILLSPESVAFDPSTGDLWAVGRSETDVVVVRRTPGQEQTVLGSATFKPALQTPRSIVVARDGQVWISDEGTKALHHRDAAGAWSSITLTDAPWGLALTSMGLLFASFPAVGEVRRYDASSGILAAGAPPWTVVGAKDTARGGLVKPQGLAIGSTGDVWVADAGANALRRWSGSSWTQVQPGATIGALSAPQAVEVGADGRVWVGDTGNLRVLGYRTDGTWSVVPSLGGTNPDLRGPLDLALDRYGNLWAADRAPGVQHQASFQAGSFGTFELHADGSFVYWAGNLTGFDAASVNVSRAGSPATVNLSVVVYQR